MKYSVQRECIMSYLMSTKEHPTADIIYAKVREQNPRISLGTVYRNLSRLVECGEILKLSCGDGQERYDANAAPHPHFYCNSCHSLYDVEMPYLADLDKLAGNFYPSFKFDFHTTIFYGQCAACNQKK